jgi:hypothetical protein
LADSSLGNRQTSKPLSRENPHGNAKAGKKETTKNLDPKSSSLDLTVTVKNQINTSVELEELVTQISDGEFDTEKLEKYDYRDELKNACIEAVAAKATRTLDRKNLRAVMNHVMVSLNKRDIKAPGGWLPVMNILRSGGPCRTFSTGREHRDDYSPSEWWETGLSFYKQELQPFDAVLRDASETLGLPTNWTETFEFLGAVINNQPAPSSELLRVQESIRERIPTPEAVMVGAM